jgi:hypothetical protein
MSDGLLNVTYLLYICTYLSGSWFFKRTTTLTKSQTPLPPTSPSITVIKHREVFSLITVTTMLFCACTERERACSKSEVKQK